MSGLWIALALMTALTLAALLQPLLRPRGGMLPPRVDFDIAVYRDQLAEVERDRERGLLDDEPAHAARTEIERRILAAANVPADRPPPARPKWVVALLAVTVTGGAFALYGTLGAPGVPDLPLAARQAEAERTASAPWREMERLTERLAKQMEATPDRSEGWMLLGRSYRALGDHPAAAEAFKRAAELTGGDPEALADYGEALVMAGGGRVPEFAAEIFEGALRKDPYAPRARYYLGIHRAQEGDIRGALQSWVDLAAVSPPDAPWLSEVRARIQMAARVLGIDPGSVKPSSGLPSPPATEAAESASTEDAPPMPPAEAMEAAETITPEERQEMVRGMVENLAERLRKNPDDAADWRRLARAYAVLGETEKAREAWRRAEAAQGRSQP